VSPPSILLLALAALVAVLAALAAVSYWAVFLRPLPRVAGVLEVPGIEAVVEIRRDARGIPSITASTWTDAAFAVGFVHAQDKLWALELQRRVAAGRLAEVVGVSAVGVDRLMRRLGLKRVSEAEWHVTHATGEVRRLLEAYAAGVDAGIGDRPLPAEFTLLRHRPEPWDPSDTIAVGRLLSFAQAGNWDAQLLRARLLKEVGPEVAEALDLPRRADDPAVLDPGGGEHQARGVAAVWQDVAALLDLSAWSPGPAPAGAGAPPPAPTASNTWVVAGSRTASGLPLLASDPHGPLRLPSPWYLVHVAVAGRELAGATAVGGPFVLLGRNERVAWGLANAGVSCQDLYVERFNPNNPLQFRDGEGWEEAVRFRETIRVRDGADVVEDVLVTRRGPLVGPAIPGHHPPLSMRWVGFDSEIDSVSWAWRLNNAHDWPSFRAAVSSCASPPLCFTYADVEGNIGMRMSGFIPLRRPGQGWVPSPGWDPAYAWQGFIPFEEMPETFNPPEGLVVAANNRVATAGFRHALVQEGSPPGRARRILQRLREAPALTREAMADLQLDAVSLPLLEAAGAVPPPAPDAAGWDGAMSPSSPGAALLDQAQQDAVSAALREAGVSERLAEQLRGAPLHPVADESPWRERMLAVALAHVPRASLPPRSGSDYGRRNRLGLDHPVGRALPVLARIFSRPPIPVAGSDDTINRQVGTGPGQTAPMYRAVYDLAAPVADTLASCPPGQSGHPGSRHYADQWDAGGVPPATPLGPPRATLTLRPRSDPA